MKRNPHKQGIFYCGAKVSFITFTFIWKDKVMGELLLTSNSAAAEIQVERTVIHWLQLASLISETLPRVENVPKWWYSYVLAVDAK